MQPLFAPSSVQLLDDERSVLFILANGSRHVARLIPSARARNLRLRLSPDRGLLLTVPAAMPATALPALLFSFLHKYNNGKRNTIYGKNNSENSS